MSPSSLAERALQTVHMARAQKRLSARPRRRPQSLLTGLLPLAAPTGYTHPTYLQFTGHRSLWEVTFCEQSRGMFASAFEGLQVASHALRHHAHYRVTLAVCHYKTRDSVNCIMRDSIGGLWRSGQRSLAFRIWRKLCA